jgi:hypothetical protein
MNFFQLFYKTLEMRSSIKRSTIFFTPPDPSDKDIFPISRYAKICPHACFWPLFLDPFFPFQIFPQNDIGRYTLPPGGGVFFNNKPPVNSHTSYVL